MSTLESTGTSSGAEETWISWYCSMSGNNILCETDKPFIEDSFNLFGLKQFIPKEFNRAMNTILDKEDTEEEESDEVLQSASLLYGLIHARFIITNNGLLAMQRKYIQKEFGECPRTYCEGQAVLPIGMADEPHFGSYKLFCPRCRDLYNCPPSQRHIDGAFFGTSFPHIFLMTYENCVPSAPTASFVPRVFGFKVHSSSASLPKKVIVLDGASYSDGGGGSSDELNFASSVESGHVVATRNEVGYVNGSGNGHPAAASAKHRLSDPSMANHTVETSGELGNVEQEENVARVVLSMRQPMSPPAEYAALQYYGQRGQVEGGVGHAYSHYVQNTGYSSDGANNHLLDQFADIAPSLSHEIPAESATGRARTVQELDVEAHENGKRQRI